MGDAEEYFPRGGKKPNVTYFKQSSNFLGAAEKGERKKKKPKKRSEDDDGYLSDEAGKEVDQSYRMCAASLSYKIAKPGVLILGRVWKVFETKINVMLPCKMQGCVMACHISEPYNKILEAYVNDETEKVRELSEMFRVGQYVAMSVLEQDGSNLMLSMMPQHVNGGIKHSEISKGDILQAAVSSVEDHGYVMDLGVANTRAFLPKDCANPDIQMEVGTLSWTCVKSVQAAADNSIVSLSAAPGALQAARRRRPGAPAPAPGTALEFTVDKPLENGIEGHVLGDTTAYIQRFHTDSVKGKKPTLGQKIKAHVLYVIPTRNTPFLTMRDIFQSPPPALADEMIYKEGDIVEDAKVLKITGRSIHFKLGARALGTMSLKRIQVDENLSDEDVIAKSYPIGSSHRVRLVVYQLVDAAWSVSDEPGVLAARYFRLEELRAGLLLAAAVTAVRDNHLVLAVGRHQGIVPQHHLSDAGVLTDPKKVTVSKISRKYKVGQAVQARVLSLDAARGRLALTLKPSLLAPALEPLCSYEQAEVGKAYTGVIKFIRDYVLVSFFNEVTAFVPRHYVTRPPIDDLRAAFHLGQIVNCTILSVDVENSKMSGSFTTQPFWPAKRRENTQKRKQQDDSSEIPKKKKKPTADTENTDDTKDTDTKKNKDKTKEDKNKKKKEKKSKTKEEPKVSEESDAIETDIQEDDQTLTPEDLALLDMSECDTAKKCKKRVVSLKKSINARKMRIKKIKQKISRIEEEGLNADNKKYHTAMHREILVIEDRIKKLTEGLQLAENNLKKFDKEEYEDVEYKSKKAAKKEAKEKAKLEEEKAILEKQQKQKEKLEAKKKEKVKKKNKDKKEVNSNKKEVVEDEEEEELDLELLKEFKVADSDEPVIEVPSAKDFWKLSADSSTKNVQDEDSSSSEEEEQEQPKKKRKKQSGAEKEAAARAAEARLRAAEAAAAQAEGAPRSADHFQRALLAAPACSQLWIAYMAFHLQSGEIDKARAVGRKALATIPFREEHEKLNVWLAMLNFEHRFGTKESQQKTLEEALQMNDTFEVHSKLLEVLVETGKPQELGPLVELMLRKYRRAALCYARCGAACYRLGLQDKARQVMQKAVATLEKKEHVSVLVQFALLERSHGSRERAEALFEQVLAVYPQRVDVCSVYVDMLIKAGDLEQVRQVMERMTSQKMPARKMKVLFKKWIEIEEKNGDEEQTEKIKQRALEFIDKAKF